MESQILFSFIIPHHNIPSLLTRCIDSIPIREDVEIIIVDDNSTPETLQQLKDIEKRHPYTTFITTPCTKGAGHARNVGIELAKGKWFLFIDADDFFYPCINAILDKYVSSDYDIIYFLSNSRFSNNLQKNADKNIPMMEVINKYLQNPTKEEIYLRFKYAVPWGKMIKASLIKEHNIRYDEVLAGNDVLFSAKSGYYASKITVEKEYAYCITVRGDSIIQTETQHYTDQRIESRIHLMLFLKSIKYPQYRHPIGDLIVSYRKYGYLKSIQKCIYILKKGYGLRYLIIDLYKNIIYYPIRKFNYVFYK